MKGKFAALFAVALLTIQGCGTSPERIAFESISTIGIATDSAVKTYFDLVVQGAVRTNEVPTVATSYSLFQIEFNQALVMASGHSNDPAPGSLVTASGKVLSTISTAKGAH